MNSTKCRRIRRQSHAAKAKELPVSILMTVRNRALKRGAGFQPAIPDSQAGSLRHVTRFRATSRTVIEPFSIPWVRFDEALCYDLPGKR